MIETHSQDSNKSDKEQLECLDSLEKDVLKEIVQCKSTIQSGSELEIHDEEKAIRKKQDIHVPCLGEANEANESDLPYLPIQDVKPLIQNVLGTLGELKKPRIISKANKDSLTYQTNTETKVTGKPRKPLPIPRKIQTPGYEKPIAVPKPTFGRSDSEYDLPIFTPDTSKHIPKETKPLETKSLPPEYSEPEPLTKQGKYQAEISSRFNYDSNMSSLTPVSAECAWMAEDNVADGSTNLHLLSSKGDVKRTFHVKLERYAKCNKICALGGQLYGLFHDGTIRTVNIMTGKARVLIKLEFATHNMTVTSEGHFIVVGKYVNGTYLREYTQEGDTVLTCEIEQTVNDISMTSCQSNRIALACGSEGVLVLVLDKSFKQVFKYKSGVQFCSYSAVFDAHGNVLVSDYNNSSIHVVGGDSGLCLQTFGFKDLSLSMEVRLKDSMLWVRGRNSVMCIQLS